MNSLLNNRKQTKHWESESEGKVVWIFRSLGKLLESRSVHWNLKKKRSWSVTPLSYSFCTLMSTAHPGPTPPPPTFTPSTFLKAKRQAVKSESFTPAPLQGYFPPSSFLLQGQIICSQEMTHTKVYITNIDTLERRSYTLTRDKQPLSK